MTPRTQLGVLIALSVLAVDAAAQAPGKPDPMYVIGPPVPPLAARIGAFLEAHHAHGQFSGTALVADGGEIIYQRSFGLANDDWNIPNGADTKFRLGSITKGFTAMLVLLLVEEGKLELEAPILRYLPDYPSETGSRVTIHHLLAHTSGIPRYVDRAGWQAEQMRHYSTEEFVARFCSGPLESEPGTMYRHNHGGYYLLGAIVEAVTGQTFLAAMRERVLDPLELHDTGFDDQYAVVKNRATGYEQVLGTRRPAQWTEMSNLRASEGMYSTVADLWKWDRALAERRLLSGKLEARMFTPGAGRYGYGWHIRDDVSWHGGITAGFSTVIGRRPARGQCVILLSNSGLALVPDAARGIEAILDGQAPPLPAPKPAQTLAQNIAANGIDAALATFIELPKATRYAMIEPLRVIGYRLIGQRRALDAAQLFEFSTRAFPEIPRSWEGLGEAHRQAGNRQLAIESCRRALALDPVSSRARSVLEKLESR